MIQWKFEMKVKEIRLLLAIMNYQHTSGFSNVTKERKHKKLDFSKFIIDSFNKGQHHQSPKKIKCTSLEIFGRVSTIEYKVAFTVYFHFHLFYQISLVNIYIRQIIFCKVATATAQKLNDWHHQL